MDMRLCRPSHGSRWNGQSQNYRALKNSEGTRIEYGNFEFIQELRLPPAAKGGDPLWKPHTGVALSGE